MTRKLRPPADVQPTIGRRTGPWSRWPGWRRGDVCAIAELRKTKAGLRGRRWQLDRIADVNVDGSITAVESGREFVVGTGNWQPLQWTWRVLALAGSQAVEGTERADAYRARVMWRDYVDQGRPLFSTREDLIHWMATYATEAP